MLKKKRLKGLEWGYCHPWNLPFNSISQTPYRSRNIQPMPLKVTPGCQMWWYYPIPHPLTAWSKGIRPVTWEGNRARVARLGAMEHYEKRISQEAASLSTSFNWGNKDSLDLWGVGRGFQGGWDWGPGNTLFSWRGIPHACWTSSPATRLRDHMQADFCEL